MGGGTAETIAAIQAARAGATTLIIERGTQLGGTTTTGGVSFPGLFDAWGKQIIAGIGWELVRESVELDGGRLPDFSRVPKRHWMNQIHVNQFLYAILAEEKCEQAGVKIAYYEFPQSITRTTDGWMADCVGFGTRRRVHCKQIIDCTGGAEAVGLIGLPRMRERQIQPGTMLFKLDTPNSPGRPNDTGGPGLLTPYYIDDADSSNSCTVTTANLKGRKAILHRVREQKRQLTHLQPEAAFRESHQHLLRDSPDMNPHKSTGRPLDNAGSFRERGTLAQPLEIPDPSREAADTGVFCRRNRRPIRPGRLRGPDGHPDAYAGLGATVDEALEDALRRFWQAVVERGALGEEDFVWTGSPDR